MSKSTHSSFQDARDQAAEFLGFLASERITLPSGEVFEIPNPSLLDDDQQTRVDALDIASDDWDRHPDLLNEDGTVKDKGALKVPHRKGGKQVENYNIQLAKALFGERFEAFKKAGGRSSDVGLIWGKMRQKAAKRADADSKSVESASGVEVVSDAD